MLHLPCHFLVLIPREIQYFGKEHEIHVVLGHALGDIRYVLYGCTAAWGDISELATRLAVSVACPVSPPGVPRKVDHRGLLVELDDRSSTK